MVLGNPLRRLADEPDVTLFDIRQSLHEIDDDTVLVDENFNMWLPGLELVGKEVRIGKLLEWAEQAKIRPNVSHRLPLEDYAAAMQLLIDRKAIGRVALIP